MPFPNPDTQFKPGNPGRPKGTRIRDRLRWLAEKSDTEGRDGYDALANIAMRRARKGDLGFWREIRDMLDGPIATKIEIEYKVIAVLIAEVVEVVRSEASPEVANRILTRLLESIEAKHGEDVGHLGLSVESTEGAPTSEAEQTRS